MSRDAWAWVRLAGGTAIVVALGWRLGTEPFLNGVRAVSGWSLVAAISVTAVTTICSAWRWTVVARGLRVGLPIGTAIAAYYRSQFLNSVLPGGVLGDVHRGLRHGQDTHDIGRGLRAVAWERTAGQVVQAGLAAIVLAALASPVHAVLPMVILGAGVVVLILAVVNGARPHRGPSGVGRVVGTIRDDIRLGVLDRRAWPKVTGASVVVVTGHAVVFLVAAHTAGVTASAPRLLPLAMLSLLAMTVPLSVGGWGPREGVTAWTFAAAGLGADRGVATATAYGVLTFVATLPGAAVLLVGPRRRGSVSERPLPHPRPHLVLSAAAGD